MREAVSGASKRNVTAIVALHRADRLIARVGRELADYDCYAASLWIKSLLSSGSQTRRCLPECGLFTDGILQLDHAVWELRAGDQF
jgi:hypothetical protein